MCIRDSTSSTEITSDVLSGISDQTESLKRSELIEENKKRIIKVCESSEEIECRVRSFFSGETYKLEKVVKIKDVRLVYAPPAYVGEYGGEVDNWMYPRHTGDFALLRAYVGKDQSIKEFDKENIPYKSKSFLKISAKGVSDGDFVMVLGYPGRTNRLLTFNEINWDLNIGFKESIKYLQRGIKLIEDHTNESDGSKLKYRGRKSGFENYFKKISGQNDGARNFNLLEIEKENWERFLKFANSKASKVELSLLRELLDLIDESLDEALARRYYGNSTLISMAQRLYRNAVEQEKSDQDRKQGYQERDQERITNRIKRLDYSFDYRVDQAIFLDRLLTYKTFDASLRRPTYSNLLGLDKSEKIILSKVDEIYSTNYKTSKNFLQMMNMSLNELNKSNDPLIIFAKETFEESLKYEKEFEEIGAKRQLLKSKFIKLLKFS